MTWSGSLFFESRKRRKRRKGRGAVWRETSHIKSWFQQSHSREKKRFENRLKQRIARDLGKRRWRLRQSHIGPYWSSRRGKWAGGTHCSIHQQSLDHALEARLDQMRDCFDEKQKHGRLQHENVGKFPEWHFLQIGAIVLLFIGWCIRQRYNFHLLGQVEWQWGLSSWSMDGAINCGVEVGKTWNHISTAGKLLKTHIWNAKKSKLWLPKQMSYLFPRLHF